MNYTDFKLKGSIYPEDEEVYYQAETDITSSDILRTLQWLKLDPKASVAAVYKKMLAWKLSKFLKLLGQLAKGPKLINKIRICCIIPGKVGIK